MSLPSINFLHLMVSKISPGQYLIGQGHYSKVKGQLRVTQCCCTPTAPNQCPQQVLTSYTLQLLKYSTDKMFKLKVTTARSNQGHTMMLHTYNPEPMSLPSITTYTLRFMRYSPDRLFPMPTCPNARPPLRTPWGKTIP